MDSVSSCVVVTSSFKVSDLNATSLLFVISNFCPSSVSHYLLLLYRLLAFPFVLVLSILYVESILFLSKVLFIYGYFLLLVV